MEINGELKEQNKIEILQDEKVGLDQLFAFCNAYNLGQLPTSELKTFLDRVSIRRYLTLDEKIDAITMLLIKKIFPTEDNVRLVAELEMAKLWYILLRYTNVEVEGYEKYMNAHVYDNIYMAIGDILLTACGMDYQRTCDMFDQLTKINDIQEFIDNISLFDENSLKKATKDFKNSIKYAADNAEVIDKLTKIAELA